MVRLSSVLKSIKYARRQKYIREKKGVYEIKNHAAGAENILKALGKSVIDPLTYVRPPPKEWKPQDLPDDFRLEPYKKEKKKPRGYEAWHLSCNSKFTSGLKQACLLTNTQKFNGLPKSLDFKKLKIENQDELVKDAIMYSQVWNNSRRKLPKRVDFENLKWNYTQEYGIKDSKAGHVLLDCFLRIAQSVNKFYPDQAIERRVFLKPSVSTHYKFKGERIHIRATNERLIVGYRPLKQFGDDSLIEASKDHQLIDMYPVSPTIDLVKTIYPRLQNHGAFKEEAEIPCSHPQILFRVNPTERSVENLQAFNLMTTFAVAYHEASYRYKSSGELETPITVININNSYNAFNFLVFQLNTMKDGSVKNFVWCDHEPLFKKVYCKPWLEPDRKNKPPTYKDFNPNVFKKFLALYMYDYDQD